MSDVTIDKVQIEVEASAKSANKVLEQLERNLKSVKSAMAGFDTSGIEKLQKALDGIGKAANNASNVKVTPKVDTSNITKSEKQISNSVANLQDRFTRLGALANAALGGDKSAITSFQRQAVSMQAEIDVVQNKLRRLGDTRIASDTFARLIQQSNVLDSQLTDMKHQMDAIMSGKKVVSDNQFKNLSENIVKTRTELDSVNDKMREMEKAGTAYLGDPFQKYRDSVLLVQNDLDSLRQKIDSIKESKPKVDTSNIADNAQKAIKWIDTLAKKIASLGSAAISKVVSGLGKAFEKVKEGASKARSAVGKLSGVFDKGFMKILKYGLGIRSIYVLFRRLRKAVVESFGELQKSGAFFQTTKANIEGLKTSLATLKFQFGAAFEPIFNTVAPALQSFINYLIKAMNVLSAFIAKVSGKDTYSKVAAVTLAAANNTASAARAAKELNKQLQGFDELNNLTTNDNAGGGGGGGGGASGDSAVYEEASVDSALGDFAKKLADSIEKGDWEGVGTLLSNKLTEMMQKIPWDSIFEAAANFGTNLAKFLKGLITPGLFTELGKTVANAIKVALTGLKSFAEELAVPDPETGKTGWEQFGESIAAGINAFVAENPLKLAAETFSAWALGITEMLCTAVKETNWTGMVTAIDEAINAIPMDKIGFNVGELANELANAVYKLVSDKKTWIDLGTKIADGINGFFEGMNQVNEDGFTGWEVMGKAIGDTMKNFSLAMITALNNVNWDDVGQGIADFMAGIDLTGVTWDLIKLASTIVSKIGEALTSFKNNATEKAKIEGAIVALLAAITITHSVPVTLMLAAALGGIYLGEKLYEILSGNKVEQSFIDELSDIVNGLFGDQKIDFNLFAAIQFVFEELTGQHDPEAGKTEKALRAFILDTYLTGAFGKARIVYNIAEAIDFVWSNKNSFASGVKALKDDLLGSLKNMWDGVTYAEAGEGPNGMPSDVAENVIKTKGLKQELEQYGRDIWAGIKGGFQAAIDWLEPVQKLWDKLVEKIKGIFGIDSPAKTMIPYGEYICQGILSGFMDWPKQLGQEWSVDTAISTLKSALEAQLTQQFTGWDAGSIISQVASLTLNISSKLTTSIEDMKDDIEELKKKIKKKLEKTKFKPTIQTPKGMSKVKKSVENFLSGLQQKAKLQLSVQPVIGDLASWVQNKIISPVNLALGKLANKGIKVEYIKPVNKAKGGYTDVPTNVIFGEDGGEAIIPLERNLGAIDKIATVMLNGMEKVSKYRYSASPSALAFGGSSMSQAYVGSMTRGDSEALQEQNKLLAEQNRLLQIIANKDVTISSRDVFNATRSEAQNYNNRTGNSPFLF